MQRTYLFVPPEERLEVQALGAHWDGDSKRWYVEGSQVETLFARWLPGAQAICAPAEDEFTIVSSEAYVASATSACQECGSSIEVICIHCESGTVSEEPLRRFTVFHIWAIDDELVRLLQPWPNFHSAGPSDDEVFANHCPSCGMLQDDFYFHSEPGDVFFDIPNAPAGSIRLDALAGRIRLSGDEHFQV